MGCSISTGNRDCCTRQLMMFPHELVIMNSLPRIIVNRTRKAWYRLTGLNQDGVTYNEEDTIKRFQAFAIKFYLRLFMHDHAYDNKLQTKQDRVVMILLLTDLFFKKMTHKERDRTCQSLADMNLSLSSSALLLCVLAETIQFELVGCNLVNHEEWVISCSYHYSYLMQWLHHYKKIERISFYLNTVYEDIYGNEEEQQQYQEELVIY